VNFVSAKKLKTPKPWFNQVLDPDLVSWPHCPPLTSNCPLLGAHRTFETTCSMLYVCAIHKDWGVVKVHILVEVQHPRAKLWT